MNERKQRLEFDVQEFKFAGGEAMTFEGYGAVFGNKDSYGDVIEPGAFANSLAQSKKSGRWPMMLLQHGGMGLTAADMMPIGVWTGLSEDGHGLRAEGKLADTPRAQEVYQLMKMSPRPAIGGLSIGYYAKKFTAGTKPSEPRRKLEEIDLVEVSIVSMPANAKARIDAVKSIDEIVSVADAEDFLREVGQFSISEAKGIIARIKRAAPREAGGDLKNAVLHLFSGVTP